MRVATQRGEPQPAPAGSLVEVVVVLVDGLDDAAARRGDRGAGAGAAVPRPVAARARPGVRRHGAGPSGGTAVDGLGREERPLGDLVERRRRRRLLGPLGHPRDVAVVVEDRDAGLGRLVLAGGRSRVRRRRRLPAAVSGSGRARVRDPGWAGSARARARPRWAPPAACPSRRAGSSAGRPRAGGRRPPRCPRARWGRRRTRAARRRCRPRWTGRSCRGRATPGPRRRG